MDKKPFYTIGREEKNKTWWEKGNIRDDGQSTGQYRVK